MKRLILLFLDLTVAASCLALTVQVNRDGHPGYDSLSDILLVHDGLIFVGTTMAEPGADWPDMYVAHGTPNGDIQWEHAFSYDGRDDAVGVIPTMDNGYLLFGATNGQNNGNCDALAIHLDSEGLIEWTREFGRNGDDMIAAAVSVPDGYLLAGHSRYDKFQRSDLILVKLTLDGEIEWHQFYGGPDDEQCAFAVKSNDHTILLGGVTRSGETVSADMELMLLDFDGNVLNHFHQYSNLATYAVAAIPMQNGFLVTGHTFVDSTLEQPVPFLLRLDQDGHPVADRLLDSGGPMWVNALERTPSGYLMIGGTMYHGDQGAVWIFEENGEILHQEVDNTPGWDSINALVYDETVQALYFAGESSTGTDTGFDFYWGSMRRDADDLLAFTEPPAQEASLRLGPNPFNASSTLTIELPHRSTLRAVIYDILGREAFRLIDGSINAGKHQFVVDGTCLASGVYFLVIDLDGQRQPVQRLVLVR